MRAGALDRRVSILRRSTARNDYGEQVETFPEYASVWAQKLDVAGREAVGARTTFAENTARFRMRYRSDLLHTDRLSCGGVEYDIVQISEVGRREMTEIVAVARVA